LRSAFTPVSGVIDHEHEAMAKAPDTTTRASDTGAWYCGRASKVLIVWVSGWVSGESSVQCTTASAVAD
jgi:hypothetical protein